MTLLIAILLIKGFGFGWWWYVIVWFVWTWHLVYHLESVKGGK